MHSLAPDYLTKLRLDAQEMAALRTYKRFKKRVGSINGQSAPVLPN